MNMSTAADLLTLLNEVDSMFGSRKDEEKMAKLSLWPWKRNNVQVESEDTAEQSPDVEVHTALSTQESKETSEITIAVSQPFCGNQSFSDVDSPLSAKQIEEDKSCLAISNLPPPVKDVRHVDKSECDSESVKKIADICMPISEKSENSTKQKLEVTVVVSGEEHAGATVPDVPAAPELESGSGQDKVVAAKSGFFSRMRSGLNKTRSALVEGVTELFIGKKEIDDDLLEELETKLLMADVGVEATSDIMEKLSRQVKYKELDDSDALIKSLKTELRAILEPAEKPLMITGEKKPYVILVVGVNGVGKTTTIGKLARKLQKQDKSVMLAAGDTFRAAAVEQLQVWGQRINIPVIAQHAGADGASVVFDSFEAAKARGADVLIADTAGRLHNKEHLMEELKKVKRVLSKLDASAPHEVLLVLDAGTGQNALSQVKLFHESLGLTGMALTKLDGTAKGGVIFALAKQSDLPIRFLGVGEQIDDLRPFVAGEFVDALFGDSK